MASLYITEYPHLFGLHSPVPVGAPSATQKITIGASTQSAAFSTNTRLVRLHTDGICSIVLGANPTATTNDARFAANQTEFWGVAGGDKVAVVTNT